MQINMGWENSESPVIMSLLHEARRCFRDGQHDLGCEIYDAVDLLEEIFPAAWAEIESRYPLSQKEGQANG